MKKSNYTINNYSLIRKLSFPILLILLGLSQLSIASNSNFSPNELFNSETVTECTPPTIICPQNIVVNADVNLCGANIVLPQPNTVANCPIGSALEFDGTDDYVALQLSETGPNSIAQLTVEAWVNTNFISSSNFDNMSIFDLGGFLSVYVTGTGRLGFWTGDDWFPRWFGYHRMHRGKLGVLNDGSWHHIAAVYDGTDKILYIDGIQAGAPRRNIHQGRGIGKSGESFGFIGDRSGSASYYNGPRDEVHYEGKIDEVRYWHVARTQTEIQNNMKLALNGDEEGLIAYYNFDEGAGTTITDLANNDNTGTLFNMDPNTAWVDNYTSISLTNNITNTADASGIYDIGNTEITWTATDRSGNSSTCIQTVTVIDNEAPVANVSVLPNATAECKITVTAPTATDNCAGQISGVINDPLTYTAQGTYTINWTYDDGNGNTSSQLQTVIFDDITPPALDIDCPDNIKLCGAQTVSWTDPAATDVCGEPVITQSHFSGDYFDVGSTTVTYDFTDVGGNVTSCSFVVTIYELPEPSIAQIELPPFCQGLIILSTEVSNEANLEAPLSYEWADGFGTESEITVSQNGTYTVTVSDAHGCGTETSAPINLVPSNILSAYVMIAEKEIDIKESTVNGGGLGVLDPGKKAKIKKNSFVYSFVKAADIDLDDDSTIDTEIYSETTVSLPPFYENDHDCETEDVTIEEDETMTLSGEIYGKIKVKKGATLFFDSPEIYMEDFDVKDDATIEFLQSANLMVEKEVKIDKNVTVSSNENSVTFYSSKKVEIKEGANITANFYSEKEINVHGKSNNPSSMTGLFISMEKIKSHEFVDWYASASCGAGTEPDGADCDPLPIVSSNGNSILTDMFISPNPSMDEVDLQFRTTNDSELSIIITDVLGAVKMTSKHKVIKGVNSINFDLRDLINGVYMVRIQDGIKIHSLPLVKN